MPSAVSPAWPTAAITPTLEPAAIPALPQPRVLFVATSPGQGGIERHSVQLAVQICARGMPLQYACRPDFFVDQRCRAAGIPAIPLRPRNSGDLSAALRLARRIVSGGIDIVHVHSRRDFVPALLGVAWARRGLSGRRANPRLVLHMHLIRSLGEPARLSGRLFARHTDAIVAVSEAVRGRLLEDHRFAPSFVRLIHNGVDLPAYALPGSARWSALRRARRREWGITDNAMVIGMVGRLDAKGQEALLRAAPALQARRPGVHLVLVGPEGGAGDRQRLETLGRTLGLAPAVTILGAHEDIPSDLAGFDILAHLPADESFGLALTEAMAAGLPTVATAVGGCIEVVKDGTTGLLVPLGDPAALEQALSRLVRPSGSAALRARLGAAGRQVAEQEFSMDRQVDRLQDLYGQLCRLPRRPVRQ